MTRPLVLDQPQTMRGIVAIPVRTGIVQPGEDLCAIVAQAVRGIARPGDVVAVSETALAIAQGQTLPAQAVRPSKLAHFICRRAGPLATVNQPESLQLVIDRVGAGKVVFACVLQALGRLVGLRGLFYRVMGEAITAIDGYTGTMPPFDRVIVFEPRDPAAFAESFFQQTGIDCAVVDANDLAPAKLLGASTNAQRSVVARALDENPHGNSDEQTPIVVLKWRGDGASPLLRSDARA